MRYLAGVLCAVFVAGCGATKTITKTVAKTQTVTTTQTVTVTHVRTRTHVIHEAVATESALPEEGQTYSGNGGKNLGTITVSTESTLEWTNDGAIFQVFTSEGVPVNSQAHGGCTVLEAGTYHHFQVNAVGNWTIKIVPR